MNATTTHRATSQSTVRDVPSRVPPPLQKSSPFTAWATGALPPHIIVAGLPGCCPLP